MMRDQRLRKNIPQYPGFFWARSAGYKYWNLLVYVQGEAPFLFLEAWEYNEGILRSLIHTYDIEEFGPEIAKDPPPLKGLQDEG
jgi:hypothetical protein